MSVKEKKNNGGFSLVELIVVIAISVVLIGACLLYTSPSPRDA